MSVLRTNARRLTVSRFHGRVSAGALVAALAAGVALSGGPAWAAGGNGRSVVNGGDGGLGGIDGSPADATGKAGGAGSTTSLTGSGGGGAVNLATGNGAAGGAGGPVGSQALGSAGATGAAGLLVSSATTISTSVTGGTGGAGEANLANVNSAGGGGGGGVGVSATADTTVSGAGVVTGGTGAVMNGTAGGGGGGVGIFSSANVTVEAGGQVTGGSGDATLSRFAGGGGEGAAAIVLTGGGTVQNSGALLGGNGERAVIGDSGDGGAGVQMLAGGTVINAAGGTITGGTLAGTGHGGHGGAGITGAGISVINAGTITGGTGGDAPQAAAVQFTGGVNSLEIQAGSIIAGNVAAFSTADTFKLGGATDSSFDVSQIGPDAKYQGFGIYEKTGASTWALTGTTAAVTPWTLSEGILQISSDSNLGDPTGGLTFNGGTLETTADITSARTVALTGSGTFLTDPDTTLTLGNVVSGAGDLTKAGDGTLVLTGANTYSGGTTITTGILQLGNGGTSGSIVGDIADNATLTFDRSDALKLDGAISGSGVVNQIGSGATTLSGQNTYSGGTTIAAGTLIGSATSFGSGAIVDDAALVIDQPDDATMANAINGTGAFTKRGAGRLDYTGTGDLDGATTVAEGTLAVDGALANSSMTVLEGATLAGSGTVGATTVQSGGSIAPGGSLATLNVNGAYTQAGGATYQVEVDPTSNASDSITVKGAAELEEGAVLNVTKTTDSAYVLGTKYTILTTTDGLTGKFDLAGETDVTAFLGLVDTYDADNAYLEVEQMHSFGSVGQTSNQVAIGDALDSLPTSDPLPATLLNLPADEAARGDFDQLSGEIHASAKTAMLEGSHFARDAAIDRVRESFCPGDAARVADASSDRSSRACTGNSDRFAMWGEGFGSWGHTDGNDNATKLGRSTGGFFVGADAALFDNWRVGVLGGYSRSTFDVDGRNSSADSDEYHVGLYAGTQMGGLGFRAGATYTWHDVSVSRSLTLAGLGDQLTSDYNAGTTQVFGELGYEIGTGQFTLEPFANLAYVNLHTDGFVENGGAAALTGDSGDTDTTFSTLGLRPSIAFTLGNIAATMRGSLGWRHAFGDVSPISVLSFADGNPFEIAGVPIAKNAALVALGFDFNVASNVAVGVSYDGQFADGMTDNSVRGTFSVRF